ADRSIARTRASGLTQGEPAIDSSQLTARQQTMEAVKKKQLEAAEKLFAAGDLRKAKMHVDMAVAMDRSGACPEAQRARAAYRVLAAANSNKGDHYGVLGVAAPPGGRPTKESHDAVKTQHKALCDAFEADKSSAAVAGALKLVKQAFAALTDIRKNEGAVPG
uniref:J domain-containing protein n=1 Tax=Aegilops tauschii subsp. strangulata TaxID=200361 RepID=A0A453JEA6_AEGTS